MLSDTLQQDLKRAMLSREEVKVSTLRMLLSEVKNAEIQKGASLEDVDIVAVVQKEAKKRREAAAAFRSGAREEQAQKEEAELKILEGYLPSQLSDEELTKIVEETINNIGAKSLQDMGKVIGIVMGKVGQGADGSRVSSIVKEKLS